MAKILQYGYDANIALVTMGAFGVRSALVRAGYLEYEQMERLLGMGAVGISAPISLTFTGTSVTENWMSGLWRFRWM